MPKSKNVIWRFLASVKLALMTLIILATVSIIGTLIKQKEAASYYIQEYGAGVARIFEVLNITDMYSSWWFFSLLCLFAINLIVCSIDRLPRVWHLITLDNLGIDSQQLGRMRFTYRASVALPLAATAERLQRIVTDADWKKIERKEQPDNILMFAQKGAWTRLGVYIVHLSVLVIMIGAIAGTYFGFQAYVYIPEQRTVKEIFLRTNQEPVSLGFELQCDRFAKSFYSNGMLKEFRADLSVYDPGLAKPIKKSIVVNDPLSYRGLTFYLADYFPLDEFLVDISNPTSGRGQAFRVPPDLDVFWEGTGVTFRIEELVRDQEDSVKKAKISLTVNGTKEPTIFWIQDQDTVTIRQAGQEFTFSFRQLYTTLLLVTKDPGVLTVYWGCLFMLVGLVIIFFMTHRRIWVLIRTENEKESQILVSGSCNKNQQAFERRFQELVARLGAELEPDI